MFVRVENKNPYITSREYYWYTKSENVDYLFTESQLKTAADRALNNPEDIPVLENEIKETNSFIVGYFVGCASCLIGIGLGYLLFSQFN